MPQNFIYKKSPLAQMMAWCRRQQAITWADADPDFFCYMASLRHNELIDYELHWLTHIMKCPVYLTHCPLWDMVVILKV